MIFRTKTETEKVQATVRLTSEEYKEAIVEYLVKYKMLPEDVDTTTLVVAEYEHGTGKIRPSITYEKTVVNLYDNRLK